MSVVRKGQLLVLIMLVSACRPEAPPAPNSTAVRAPTIRAVEPTNPWIATRTSENDEVSAELPGGEAEDWQFLPVIPFIGAHALDLYSYGQVLGNRANAFTLIGDGEVATSWFLPDDCELGPYQALQAVMAFFQPSLQRRSVAARAGFNSTRILDPAFRDPQRCLAEESPLACELRLHQPAFALLSFGTNQVWEPEVFETELRIIIETLMEAGVVPVLSTKGDNLEGDHRINAIIARLAAEYDVPLWNFWAAIQGLPDDGLQADGEHLTWAHCDFSDPEVMTHAWPVRNLTALQVLDVLMRATQME